MWEIVLPAVAGIAGSLGASYAGARYAFSLERSRRDTEDRSKRVATINGCLVTISWCRNRIHNLRTQVIEPVRDNPFRHVCARAVIEMEAPPRLQANAPSDLTGNAALLNAYFHAVSATAHAQQAFQFANSFSSYHLSQFQPLLATLPLVKDKNIVEAEALVAALPINIVGTLRGYFDGMVECTDDARTALREAEEMLWREAKKAFPDEKFLYTQIPDDPLPDFVQNREQGRSAPPA
jgi:hypothetical protein